MRTLVVEWYHAGRKPEKRVRLPPRPVEIEYNAIVVEQAYTAVREAAPDRVWGFDSPRWHEGETIMTHTIIPTHEIDLGAWSRSGQGLL